MLTKQPKGYPLTDIKENESINYLKYRLDPKYIKHDIKQRDKQPNTDGYIEIVNDSQFPIGKIEVQVKTLGDGNDRFPCPTELISYSKLTTLPFVLICVDAKNEKIYWKHLKEELIAGKENQESVTLTFSSDEMVGPDLLYIQKWTALSNEYKNKLQHYKLLKNELNLLKKRSTPFTCLNRADLLELQTYIDELNYLIDREFSVVKKYIFHDTWKIGILLHSYKNENVFFSLFSIENGSSEPLVQYLDMNDSSSFHRERYGFLAQYGPNFFTSGEAKKNAQKFVYERFKDLIKNKVLSIRVEYLCIEIIFKYLEELSFCLGLEQKESFSIEEVTYAFEIYLPYWCHFALKLINYPEYLNYVDPRVINALLLPSDKAKLHKNIPERIYSKDPIDNFTIHSIYLNFSYLFKAIDYLKELGFKEVPMIYKRKKLDLIKDKSAYMAHEAYEENAIYHNIKTIFSNFIEVYYEFIRENNLPSSKYNYFNKYSKIILVYSFNERGVGITLYYIDKNKGKNSKCKFEIHKENSKISVEYKESTLSVEGKTYKFNKSESFTGNFLLGRNPMLNLIYKYLHEESTSIFDIHSDIYLDWAMDL